MKRPCLVCGRLTEGSRCPAHTRTATERGYGTAHQQARRAIAATLPRACLYALHDPKCPRTLIHPGDRWDAAHVVDGDPSFGWAPAHPACNQRAKRPRT